MPRGHRSEDANRKEQTPVEVITAVANRHGKVRLASLDEGERAEPPLLEKMDVNLLFRFQIPRQERSQHALDDLGRGGNVQASDVTAPQGLGMVDHPVDVSEEGAAAEEEPLARAGDTRPTPDTFDEGNAELSLQIANLAP